MPGQKGHFISSIKTNPKVNDFKMPLCLGFNSEKNFVAKYALFIKDTINRVFTVDNKEALNCYQF